jgi:Kef-type K+ transport system membrane component KefB
MIDSLLTLTKGGAFWMGIFFLVAVGLDLGISAIIGTQEPIFLLFALVIAAAFVVTGTYTLFKKMLRRGSRQDSERENR